MVQTIPNPKMDKNRQVLENNFLTAPILPKVPNPKKAQCEAQGGTWDEVRQVCILPKRDQLANRPTKIINPPQNNNQAPTPTTPVNPKAGTIETFTDSKTGEASGVRLPSGETFLGLTPAEVQQFANKEAGIVARPVNSAPVGTAQAEARRQERLNQLIQLQQQGLLSQQEFQAISEASIDWGQALTAGVASAVPAAAGTAAGGFALGALGGPAAPFTAAGGALAGGIGGFVTGIFYGVSSNIKSQQKGEIAAAKDVLANARTNMRALALITAKDPSIAEESIKHYYDQLKEVRAAYRKLQLETSGNLNKFMDDGTQDLSDFDLFLQPGGYADIQLIRLQQSINSGVPASDQELLNLYQEYNDNTNN